MAAGVSVAVKETEGIDVGAGIEGDSSGEEDPVDELHPDTRIRKIIKKIQATEFFIVGALFFLTINSLIFFYGGSKGHFRVFSLSKRGYIWIAFSDGRMLEIRETWL